MMMIRMKVPDKFVLEKSVCNHGFFMMAPNSWNPQTKTLVRPLRLQDQTSVTVSISQHSRMMISVKLDDDHHHFKITKAIKKAIKYQVKRMLRLSEEEDERINEFHKLHSDAAENGFGRLFRNPSVFEDILKTWLLCCCRFKESLEKAELLCKVTRIKKRGRRKQGYKEPIANFPTAQELSKLDIKTLATECKLGIRAEKILKFSKDVASGEINLLDFENVRDGDELYRKLMTIDGIGDFIACNVLMCMGFYNRVPVDSETVRHIKQLHGREDCDRKNVAKMCEEIYNKYNPFHTLAYWFELVEYYESKVGKLSMLEKCNYQRVAGSFIDKSNSTPSSSPT
ncbi:uncharacterized protein [Rutidosis leptorrhynchoides]|uniref:uncharacterized protein n=1 Tax=Rutidosis leptorrhynchoides TaxID=125765 RepID=UPI003A99D491